MKGWKTKTAGVAAILGGAAMILNAVISGEHDKIQEGFMMAVGGLTAIGLGHKLDRQSPTTIKDVKVPRG